MAVLICRHFQGYQHKLGIHNHHQRSTVSSEEIIALVPVQCELYHGK